jgi:DNA polymerase III delta subunit
MDYFLNEGDEINLDVIKSLSSYTKEYSIFDLQNSIAKGDKANSLKVGYNLLEKGKEMPYILAMLTKFVSIVAQSMELTKYSDFDASKKIGISKYYYMNSKNAPFLKEHRRLYQVVNALYETDLALKTSSKDEKTLFTILISKIFTPI